MTEIQIQQLSHYKETYFARERAIQNQMRLVKQEDPFKDDKLLALQAELLQAKRNYENNLNLLIMSEQP